MVDYEVDQYLLDRANIQDTVQRLWLYIDLDRWDALVTECLATDVLIDYSALMATEAYTISGKEQARRWRVENIAPLDKHQHMVLCSSVELPQPGDGVAVPDEAVAYANSTVVLVRGDKTVKNGGLGRLGVKRMEGVGKGNPWRIVSLKVFPAFMEGKMSDLFPS